MATVITWPDVVNVAPELASLTTNTQNAILATVGREVPVETWAAAQFDGQAQLAAHLGTLTRRRGDGPVTARDVGPLSTSFASMLEVGALGQTSYGVEYERQLTLLPTVRMGFVF